MLSNLNIIFLLEKELKKNIAISMISITTGVLFGVLFAQVYFVESIMTVIFQKTQESLIIRW